METTEPPLPARERAAHDDQQAPAVRERGNKLS